MMKVFFNTRGIISVILIVTCQLPLTLCSRQIYRDPSSQKTESKDEGNKQRDVATAAAEAEINPRNSGLDKANDKAFIGGTEKEINTRKTSPDEIIETARQYLGVPHCMGGTTRKCMDCSGLLVTVFGKYGIQLPHNSEEQARYGKKIDAMNELKKGDLVFFIRTYRTDHFITHSGIYVGDNKFIHTSSTNGVRITSLSDPYWKQRFVFGTRVFE
jgi:murein DD-endopeptidase / murein LD-carboxypeptidase